MKYNVGLAYLLWLLGGCGILGLHRFYLGKTGTGVLWLCSGGLCGFGAFVDLITLRKQVDDANLKENVRLMAESGIRAIPGAPTAAPKPESVEKAILRVARKNRGLVSPGEVALESDFTIDEARKALEAMATKGLAEMRIRQSGLIVFVFPEFADTSADPILE